MDAAASEKSATSTRHSLARRGTHPQLTAHSAAASTALDAQYTPSSCLLEGFSMNVATPAAGTPHATVHGLAVPAARCTSSGPNHASAQYAERNALDRAHPTAARVASLGPSGPRRRPRCTTSAGTA